MPDPPFHVLFLCTHNACRSQMAEAWVRTLSGGRVRASSAGTRPGRINPLTVAAMAEVGIDIGSQAPKGLDAVDKAGVTHVITVCDAAAAECPTFAAPARRAHWPVPDPGELAEEFPHLMGQGFGAIRDNLRDRVWMFLVELGVRPESGPGPAFDSRKGAA